MRRFVLRVCCLFALVSVARGQVSYTGGSYGQNFDGLPSAGTFSLTGNGPISLGASPISATGIPGWSIANYLGTGANATFLVGTGSAATGAAYSFGSSAASDRALGSLASAAVISRFGVALTNNTGATITNFTLSYTGEQWRHGGSTTANTLSFSYGLGATDINTGTFTAVTALNFVAPIVTATTSALDGNAAANRTAISALVSGINWTNGQTLILRWTDVDDTGSDDGLAIDDLTFSSQVAQTITFGALTSKNIQDVPFTVSATASSGLSPTFSIVSGPATISGSTITLTGTTGTVVVRASQAGNASFQAAPDVDQSFAVTKVPQTISFGALAAKTFGNAPFPVSATATSNLAPTFSIFSGPATIAGNIVTITGAGTVVVRASQAGDGTYAAAADVDQSFTVNKANQTITFGALAGKTFGNAPFTVSATSDSGLAPTFSIFSGPATVAGSTVTITGAGTVVVRASQAGNSNYNAATDVDQSFAVAPASQTITFNAPANHFTSDPPFALSASASSDLTVAFSITSGPASVSGSTVTLTGTTGTVVVHATQAGNTDYLAAAPVDQSFTVSLPPATINTQPQPQTVTAFQNATFTVSASVGVGSLTYQWRKYDTNGANPTAITGNPSAQTSALTLTNVTAADAVNYDVLITAPGGTVPSNAVALTVNKAAATVTLGSLNATFDAAPHAATATTSPAGLTVIFTYNGSGTAPTAGGSYAVVGTISDPNYAGTASGTLVIARTTQSVTFPAPLGTLRATVPFTVSATASSGLTPVTFSIVSGNATASGVNGATITIADTLAVVIRATQAGNTNYLATSFDLTLTVSTAPAAPAFAVQPTSAESYSYGDVVILNAVVTGVPEPTYQWRKDGVALTGATNPTLFLAGVTLTDAGRYELVATNPSGTTTSFSVVFTVAKKDQTITFAAPTAPSPAGTAVKLAATASSGLPVSYTIVSGAASISGSTLTGLGTTVVVRASQAGNSTAFNAAENVDRTFTFVSGGSAPFLFSSPSDQTVNAGADVTFSAGAVGTPTPTWQWQKDDVAISGATSANLTLTGVTIADAARYTIVATNSAGTATASATLTVRAAPVFTVSPLGQDVAAGANVTFTSSVTGFPTPALQWRKNGVVIPGAVSNTLTLASVSAKDAARYDVVATSSLGTATSAPATLGVTTRDFSGMYFGNFTNMAPSASVPPVSVFGSFVLYVRGDGTGVFLAGVGSDAALVALNVVVDAAGNFSVVVPTPAFATGSTLSGPAPQVAGAGVSSTTLRGSLDDTTGALTASMPELALALSSTRSPRSGSTTGLAGFYAGAITSSAAARGYVVAGADGHAYLFLTDGTHGLGTTVALDASGRMFLAPPPPDTSSVVDFGFTDFNLGLANGALSGTVHTVGLNVGGTLIGASDALAGTERLANISARGGVSPGAPLIAGFVVTGSTAKQVLIRAAGPALAAAPFSVTDALDDPVLTLYRGSSIIATNDNWSTPAASAAAITTAGTSVNAFAFRTGSGDSALLTTLVPGNYTVQVTRSTGSGQAANNTGTALVEIYEILATGEAPGTRRLVNLSARGPVAPGAPLIAGFVINGTAPQRVLLRGIGPTLGTFKVPGVLANPTLTLFRGATVLKTNDDWFRDPDVALIRDAAAKTGAFALGSTSLDASLLLYLEPGAYTAQVGASGIANGTGIALVEIYELP